MTETRSSTPRLLAGLQAGILAGLVLLGWFVVLSHYYFHAPWALMNILAASLLGNRTWGYGFSSVTWTGLASHVFASGLLGMTIGWVLPRPGVRSRISLTGLTFGVIVSLLVYQFFWLRFVPLLGEYIAPPAMWVAHLLFGIAVAQFPRFYLQLAEPDPSLVYSEPLGIGPAGGIGPEPPAGGLVAIQPSGDPDEHEPRSVNPLSTDHPVVESRPEPSPVEPCSGESPVPDPPADAH